MLVDPWSQERERENLTMNENENLFSNGKAAKLFYGGRHSNEYPTSDKNEAIKSDHLSQYGFSRCLSPVKTTQIHDKWVEAETESLILVKRNQILNVFKLLIAHKFPEKCLSKTIKRCFMSSCCHLRLYFDDKLENWVTFDEDFTWFSCTWAFSTMLSFLFFHCLFSMFTLGTWKALKHKQDDTFKKIFEKIVHINNHPSCF